MNTPFADIAALIAASPRANFGQGVSPEMVADAERHLGIVFPPSYRWWLLSYGCGYLSGYELQGLFPEPIASRDPELPLVGDIVDLAQRNSASNLWPSQLLELLTYEGDVTFFFDMQRSSADGEWPVVCLSTETSEPEDVAQDFAEFLRWELR